MAFFDSGAGGTTAQSGSYPGGVTQQQYFSYTGAGKTYRPDMGGYFSDAEYNSLKNENAQPNAVSGMGGGVGASRGVGSVSGINATVGGGSYPDPSMTSRFAPTNPYQLSPVGTQQAQNAAHQESFGSNFSGGTNIDQPAYEGQQSQILGEQLGEKAGQAGLGLDEQKLAMLKQQFPQFFTPSSAATVPTPDIAGAEAAALARAKDYAGQNALASLRAVQNAMDQRGLTGSVGPDLESGLTSSVLSGAAGNIGDVIRQGVINAPNVAVAQGNENLAANAQKIAQNNNMLASVMGLISAGGLY